MRTIFYDIENFRKAMKGGMIQHSILYDYGVVRRNNPIPAAVITCSLFGRSFADEAVEYRKEHTISILSLPDDCEDLTTAIRNYLNEFEGYASREFSATPGRYEDDARGGSGDVERMISDLIRRVDRIEADQVDLSRRLSRLSMGGGYDD